MDVSNAFEIRLELSLGNDGSVPLGLNEVPRRPESRSAKDLSVLKPGCLSKQVMWHQVMHLLPCELLLLYQLLHSVPTLPNQSPYITSSLVG